MSGGRTDTRVERAADAERSRLARALLEDLDERQAKIERARRRLQIRLGVDHDLMWFDHNIKARFCDGVRCTSSPERRR